MDEAPALEDASPALTYTTYDTHWEWPRYRAGDFVATDNVAAEPHNTAEEVIVTEESYFVTLAPSSRDEPYLIVPESGPLPEDACLAERRGTYAQPKQQDSTRFRRQLWSNARA